MGPEQKPGNSPAALYKLPDGKGYRIITTLEKSPSVAGDQIILETEAVGGKKVTFSIECKGHDLLLLLQPGQEIMVDVASLSQESGVTLATTVEPQEFSQASLAAVPVKRALPVRHSPGNRMRSRELY